MLWSPAVTTHYNQTFEGRLSPSYTNVDIKVPASISSPLQKPEAPTKQVFVLPDQETNSMSPHIDPKAG